VSDAGPGVPVEQRERIFQPFHRGPSAASHAPGSGVGLALVAQFASLHGGRAWVEPRTGGGASFQVLLPDSPEVAPPADSMRTVTG
jgi:two-component system, OmpR family, sensor histidine kinase MtrB